MEWLWGLLLKLIGMGGKGAKDAIVGYDRLTGRYEHRLDKLEARVDECDQERRELLAEVRELKWRVADCDQDRTELRNKVNHIETKVTTLEQKTQ
jgi:chromosome segregation ATPase